MATVAVRDVHVALRGFFQLDRLEKLIEIVDPIAKLSEPTRVSLDLRGLAFIGPACLASLSAAMVGANERGGLSPESIYLPPRNRMVAKYLDRIDFNRLVTGAHLDETATRRPPSGFRPIQLFSDESHIDEVADSLTRAATEALALKGQDKVAVSLATSEVMRNVVQHAQTRCGIAIAQRATSKREFEIAVADAGIGIEASLRQNDDYRAQIEAGAHPIELALTPGVSAKPGEVNHGIGLAAIRGMLSENGGALVVRSGTGRVEDGAISEVRRSLIDLPGTVVAVRMKIGRPFELALFSELAGTKRKSTRRNSRETLAKARLE